MKNQKNILRKLIREEIEKSYHSEEYDSDQKIQDIILFLRQNPYEYMKNYDYNFSGDFIALFEKYYDDLHPELQEILERTDVLTDEELERDPYSEYSDK